MRALTGVALLLSATALALSVVTLLRDDDPQSRRVTLGLTEKEDEFKFSDDVAPEARSEEDVSAGDSFVFSGDVSGERKGRLAGACAVADKGEPTCHATYTFGDGQITVAGVPDFSQDAETFQLPVTGGSEAYEGASGQVSVRENGNAEHKMTLLLAERD